MHKNRNLKKINLTQRQKISLWLGLGLVLMGTGVWGYELKMGKVLISADESSSGSIEFLAPSDCKNRVFDMAKKKLGQDTRKFLPDDPRHACASYVSHVLISAGVLNPHEEDDNHPNGYYAAVSDLQDKLRQRGCTPRFSRPVPKSGKANDKSLHDDLAKIQKGDVVIYIDEDGAPHHTGIASGENGSNYDSSSREEEIVYRVIRGLLNSGDYKRITAWNCSSFCSR